MTVRELFASIKKQQFYRIYLFFGQQTFLLHKAITDIRNSVLNEQNACANSAVLEFPEADPKDIAVLARSAPLFGNKRVLLLKGVDHIPSSQQQSIISMFSDIPSSTVLIMKADSKIKGNNPIIKALKGLSWATVVDFTYVDRQDIKKWAHNIVYRANCTISDSALELLVDMYQGDMNCIYTELSKLIAYSGGTIHLTNEHVKALAPGAFSASIFELSDAVANRNAKQATLLLSSLLKAGITSSSIIGMMTKHFKDIWITKDITSRESSHQEVCAVLKIGKRYVGKYIKQANYFSHDQLRKVFSHMLNTDVQIKTTPIKAEHLLEKLIVQLCQS